MHLDSFALLALPVVHACRESRNARAHPQVPVWVSDHGMCGLRWMGAPAIVQVSSEGPSLRGVWAPRRVAGGIWWDCQQPLSGLSAWDWEECVI